MVKAQKAGIGEFVKEGDMIADSADKIQYAAGKCMWEPLICSVAPGQ